MPSFPGPDTASAHWTFDGLDASGTLLREGGRLALDLTPRVLAAPNYGLGLSPGGRAGKLTLNGTTHYADMAAAVAARWYAAAPTTALTVAIVSKFTAPVAARVLFSCLNAGPTRGLIVDFSTADRIRVAGYDAAGAILSATMTADGPLAGRTRVVVMTLQQAVAWASAFVDGQPRTCAFAGSANPIAYDAAVMPAVGSAPGGGSYDGGDLFAIRIWPRVLLTPEIGAFTEYWRSNKV